MIEKWELCIVEERYGTIDFYSPGGYRQKEPEEILYDEWPAMSKRQRKAITDEWFRRDPSTSFSQAAINRLLTDGWQPMGVTYSTPGASYSSGRREIAFRRPYRGDAS